MIPRHSNTLISEDVDDEYIPFVKERDNVGNLVSLKNRKLVQNQTEKGSVDLTRKSQKKKG